MKRKLSTLAVLAGSAASALAEGDGSYTVPAAVTGAIDDLSSAGGALAAEVAPAIGDIVISFIGIAAILWVGRFLWRKAQGRS